MKMEKTIQRKTATPKIQTTIHGHPVTLYFAQKPNPNITFQIKQALIGAYLQSEEQA